MFLSDLNSFTFQAEYIPNFLISEAHFVLQGQTTYPYPDPYYRSIFAPYDAQPYPAQPYPSQPMVFTSFIFCYGSILFRSQWYYFC